MLIQQPLKSIADVRHKSHMASTLDSNGQLALMESASAGDAAGNDFGTLADVFAQAGQILVINAVDAINAEAANLLRPRCIGREERSIAMIRLPPCKIGIIDSERQIALVLNQCKVIVAASRIGGSSGCAAGRE